MSGLMDFGPQLGPNDPATVSLGWVHDLAPWVWVLIILAVAGLSYWSYARMLGAAWARFSLATVRTVIILAAVVLLAGPVWVITRERVEPDVLLVMADRSASMTIADHRSDWVADRFSDLVLAADDQKPWSRDRVLQEALAQADPGWTGTPTNGAQDEVLRRVVWLGFDRGAFPLDVVTDEAGTPQPQLGEATGIRTSLKTSLQQALQRVAGQPISGVVLFSDGRSSEPTDGALIEQLQQMGVGVFAVPLGATEQPLDLRVARVDAPQKAFVNDVVPVTVEIDQRPAAAAVDPATLTITLTDGATGEVLAEANGGEAVDIDPDSGRFTVRMTTRPEAVGPVRWVVTVKRADGSRVDAVAGETELITDNNERSVRLTLIDRPLRVLYVEGRPRWEYRYLKNLMLREESIESSILLLSADRQFAQEGDRPITRMPTDREEMRPFDVVIIGDVPYSFFSAEEAALVQDQVSGGGAGLIWIGGDRHTPMEYEATPLADVLPMRRPGSVTGEPLVTGFEAGLEMMPTPLAERLSVLQLAEPDELEKADMLPVTQRLPGLQWRQALGPLKPTAEVLAEMAARDGSVSPEPMVVLMRFGAGKSIMIGTDETWRWREGRGSVYFEKFWVQLIRLLGRSRVQASDEPAQLRVGTEEANAGDPVLLELDVREPALVRSLPNQLTVLIGPSGGSSAAAERVTLRPREQDATSEVTGQRVYEAVWRPTRAGELELLPEEPTLRSLGVRSVVQVYRPDDELRQPLPDHERLALLAESTGGRVVAVDELNQLAELLPNRTRRIADDEREPILTGWWPLLVIVGLLTLEWVGRKGLRLV